MSKSYYENLFDDRKKFCDSLINFISTITPPENNLLDEEYPEEIDDTRVISIDAAWGYGKTTFIKALNEKLIENFFTVFTFNAWTNDYETDALTSFINELIPQMLKTIDNNESNIQLMKNFLLIGNELADYLTGINFIKKLNTIKENKNFLDTLFNKENDVNNYFNNSPLQKKQAEFLKTLNQIYNAINEIENEKLKKLPGINTEEQLKNTPEQKIIILIDELDRCKPTFAIELLERIKHLFDTGKYLFIFTINAKQLAESVKQIYGNCFDESGYFRRFFDYEFYLPLPNRISYIEEKTEILIKRFNSNSNFLIIFKKFLIETDFSLRKYNTIFKEINLLLRLQGNDPITVNESIYITFIVIIKYYEPSFFYNILIKKEKNTLSIVNEKKLMEIEFKNYPNLKKVNEIFMPVIINPEYEGKVNQVNTIAISFESWLSESLKIKKITKEIIDKLTIKNTKFDTYILMYSYKIDLNKKFFTFVKMRNKENPGTDIILQAYKILPDSESLFKYSTPVEINKLDFNFISKKTINKILLLNKLE